MLSSAHLATLGTTKVEMTVWQWHTRAPARTGRPLQGRHARVTAPIVLRAIQGITGHGRTVEATSAS